jgi:thermostable 8-oxoguanine DNA glycosylase
MMIQHITQDLKLHMKMQKNSFKEEFKEIVEILRQLFHEDVLSIIEDELASKDAKKALDKLKSDQNQSTAKQIPEIFNSISTFFKDSEDKSIAEIITEADDLYKELENMIKTIATPNIIGPISADHIEPSILPDVIF